MILSITHTRRKLKQFTCSSLIGHWKSLTIFKDKTLSLLKIDPSTFILLTIMNSCVFPGRSEPKGGVGDPCAGCNKPILDKFLLNVLERGWHASCVRCCECLTPLTEKCFSREAKLYCRNDFFRYVVNIFFCFYLNRKCFGHRCYGS